MATLSILNATIAATDPNSSASTPTDLTSSLSTAAPSSTTPSSTPPSSTESPTSSSSSSSSTTSHHHTTSETSATSTTTFTASSASPSVVVTTSFTTEASTSTGEATTVTQISTVDTVSTVIPSGPESTSSSSTSSAAALNTGGTNNNSNNSHGLSTGGITAIAVVVPVVVVALLVLAGIILWRKRKQKKAVEEVRRKEVEDYNYNPNNDPTLPAVASESALEMSEDHNSGYRGWGAATSSHRKMSTTLSGGHTQGQLSDVGSNGQFGGHSPNARASDGQSAEPLYQQREATSGEDGAAPARGADAGMRRGPSNASSTYSAGLVSDLSEEPVGAVLGQPYTAYRPNNGGYGYSQHGPYGDGTYGGNVADPNGMPVVRDVGARRDTRIQQPGNYPQGNSGISQNF